jgi:thymidylate synthase
MIIIMNNIHKEECKNCIFHELNELLLYRGNCTHTEINDNYITKIYEILHEEQMYLNLLKNTLKSNKFKMDRTKVGTYSVFGRHLEFGLQNNVIPLLSTKRVYFKGVVEELLWFLKGSTNANELSSKGVKIWDANGSRNALDELGFTDREEGDLGPIYGHQWTRWGKTDTNEGINQIDGIIKTLKTNKHSRRIILSAWNVGDLSQMALYPCHIMCQFYVEDDDKLCCSMYQRSADLFLGVPFNIASYALLTHMIAHVTDLKAHRLVMNFGDCHVYSNHVDQVNQQCERFIKTNFPKLNITNETKNIYDITFDDLQLVSYIPQPSIQAPMAV